MRVVLDTNVLVAALLTNGLCHEVVHRAARLRAIASSPALLEEPESVVGRGFRLTPAVKTFLQTFRQQVYLVEPRPLPTPGSRDPDDDVVLATAIAAEANCIVTGDQDLLILGEYEDVALMTPRQFLEWLDRR